MATQGLTIGRLAEASAVNLETIRYYERIGLMPEPARSTGGYRQYDDGHRRRLTFIRRARALGFGVADIRSLLELAQPERRDCEEVRVIAAAQLDEVRAKLSDLRRLEKILADALSRCGDEDVAASCRVLEMLEAPEGGPP